MQYRREIDGLRALAVLPVMLFHAGIRVFSGGFVGVDIFFVISGYLITTILIGEIGSGRFTLVQFYERRARRILPALFFVMALCLPCAWLWLLPSDMKDFADSLIAVPIFVSNLLFWRNTGYFDTASELKPLLHTWSLAVEEQYYLFFPIFLMLTWKQGQRRVLGILITVAIGSLLLAEWGSTHKADAAFYLMPTRIWELLVGAFAAFHLANEQRPQAGPRIDAIASVAGLILVLIGIFEFDNATPFPGFDALIPTVGAVLIILFASPANVVGRLLGSALPVQIGLISYSAYLWHQPMFAFARHLSLGEPSQTEMLLLFALALVLAWLSWKFVETPFRSSKRFGRQRIFVMGGFGSLLFISLGVAGHWTGGFESRLSAEQHALMDYRSYPFEKIARSHRCFLQPEESHLAFEAECDGGNAADALLIWGDSHAAALSIGLRKLHPALIQYNASGCPPLVGIRFRWRPHCQDVNDFVLAEVARLKPARIFLHANWGLYKDERPLDNIPKTIAAIRRVSPQSAITLVGPVPQWQPSLPAYLVRLDIPVDHELDLPSSGLDFQTRIDQRLRAIADTQGVAFRSALDVLCRDGKCIAAVPYQGKVELTAWDYGHLTEAGSVLLAGKLLGD